MKLVCLSFFLFVNLGVCYAQVGINTTNPNSILDIAASNSSSPSNIDGILIPRLSNFPSIASMTTNQDGMLVFYTGTSFSGKGFYYWNHSSLSWIPLKKSTLDQAYDEGGAGMGKDITADSGAVKILGTDGLIVTGTLNTGTLIDNEISGAGVRMFFNPRKAVFRAGYINGNQWNDTNTGYYSVALGYNSLASGLTSISLGTTTSAIGNNAIAFGTSTTASGTTSTSFGHSTIASNIYSTAFGSNTVSSGQTSTAFGTSTIASGSNATAFGIGTDAPGYAETAIGKYNTLYDPATTTNDRLFVIGKGNSTLSRSNALIVYNNGLVTVNDAYSLPTSDGSAGQVMTTDGVGNISFADSPNTNMALTRLRPYSNSQASSYTKITSVTEDYDLNNNYNPSSNRFTAMVSGYYRIQINILINTTSSNAASTFGVAIYKNGTLSIERQDRGNGFSATPFNIGIDTIIQLNPGEYLEFYTYKSGAFPVTYFNFSNAQRNWIEIQQIR